MTAHFAFTSAGLLFVSILGLSSCSQDRSDHWALNEPTIQSSSRGPVYLKSATLKGLPGDSALVLASNDGSDTSVLVVESTCRLGDVSATARNTMSNVSKILIRDLWPEDLWKKFDSESLKHSICDFNITAQNRNNSTHSFTMNDVSLSDFTELAGGTQQTLMSRSLGFDSFSIADNESFRKLVEDSNSLNPAIIDFICENFQNEMKVSELVSPPSEAPALTRLISAPIKDLVGIDPREEKTVQTCRLLRIETNALTQQSHYSLLPSFKLTFPPPKLEIKSDFQLRNVDASNWAAGKVFSIQMTNMSQVRTAVELPNEFGRLHMRLVTHLQTPLWGANLGDFVQGSRVIDEPMTVTITGESRRISNGDHVIYEIDPHETLIIEAVIHPTDQCIGLMGLTESAQEIANGGWFAGFFYSFTSPITFRQYQSWRGSNDPSGSTVALDTLTEMRAVGDTPTAFSPSPKYLTSFDIAGRLPPIRAEYPHDGPSQGIFVSDACYYAKSTNAKIGQ